MQSLEIGFESSDIGSEVVDLGFDSVNFSIVDIDNLSTDIVGFGIVFQGYEAIWDLSKLVSDFCHPCGAGGDG
jgi:hypothetical protein